FGKYVTGLLTNVKKELPNGNKIMTIQYAYRDLIRAGALTQKTVYVLHYQQNSGNDLASSSATTYHYNAYSEPTKIVIRREDLVGGGVWLRTTRFSRQSSTTSADWCIGLADSITVTDRAPSGV